MSKALQKAVVARVRGDEVLTGDAAAAQTALAALLATTTGGHPAFRYGAKGSGVLYPEVTFREDGGVEMIGGVDIGIPTWSVLRMEIWEQTHGGLTIPVIADYLELLFDCRRRAPVLPLEGENHCWWGELFAPLQSPFQDTQYDAFFGLLAFRFAEARP